MSPIPLRILVDLSHLRPRGEGGGIKPALRELVHWLGLRGAANLNFVIVASRMLAGEMEGWVRSQDRLVWEDEAPRDLAARSNCDVVYCPFGITRWACPGIPTVAMIVDLLHLDFPESLPAADRNYRHEYFQVAAEHTDLFQVISDYTAGQLCSHYGIPPDRVIRTYLPVHSRLPRAAHGSARPVGSTPYFFYPANAWAHKNHATLLVAYSIYLGRAGAAAWRLVLTGHSDANMERLKNLATTLGLSSHVDFLGYVDDPQLARVWDEAGALVFPSLHEGFGIPLLEAMERGVPIVASASTAVPEIVGDAAILVAGRAPLELARGMQQIADDPSLRAALVVRGRARLADFSADVEFGKLLRSFYTVATTPARWRRCGYHPVDGLAEPYAMFALPLCSSARTLHYATRPLGVARTLEFCTGDNQLAKIVVAADAPVDGTIRVPANARSLCLRTLDPSRLSPTDPRTHGVLLARLCLQNDRDQTIDLLEPRAV